MSVNPGDIFAGVTSPPGIPFPAFPVIQVVSTPSAIRANPALAAPNNTLSGFNFESFAGNPAGL